MYLRHHIAASVILLAGIVWTVPPALGQVLPSTVNLKVLFHTAVTPMSPGAPSFIKGSSNGDTALSVFLFLSPECPLCRSYTTTLNQLYLAFGKTVRFYGIIAGKTDQPVAVTAFIQKYHILFPLYQDPQRSVVTLLRAAVTPQAIVLDGKGMMVYSGLIDNWVVDLGVQRAHVDRHYLQETLTAMAAGRRPATARTTPVGCLINAF